MVRGDYVPQYVPFYIMLLSVFVDSFVCFSAVNWPHRGPQLSRCPCNFWHFHFLFSRSVDPPPPPTTKTTMLATMDGAILSTSPLTLTQTNKQNKTKRKKLLSSNQQPDRQNTKHHKVNERYCCCCCWCWLPLLRKPRKNIRDWLLDCWHRPQQCPCNPKYTHKTQILISLSLSSLFDSDLFVGVGVALLL